MAYKKTPDLAVSYLHSLPETVPSKYVIFQPLDKPLRCGGADCGDFW
ncbi:MAG: hypothetical protein ACLR1T_06560 [Evtepia gabavorous]